MVAGRVPDTRPRVRTPPRPSRHVPFPGPLYACIPGEARASRREADITASVSSVARIHWRSFKWAAWLGWEMDSNWAEPWLFMVYSVIKPIAGAFILLLMYTVFAPIGQFRDPDGLAEGIPGIFYVFCGVLFPLTALRGWAQSFGRGIPLTYWFDLTRRLLLPPNTINTGLGFFNVYEILALLLASSLIFFLMSLGIFKLGEFLARRAGKIDMTTSY